MATGAERLIKLIFQGDDRVSKMVGTIESRVGTFAKNVEQATGPLANMAGLAIKTQAAIIAMAGAGLAYATKEAGNFNDATNEIYTLLDITGQQMQTFRGQILDYARGSTSSIDDINAAIYTAISAGTKYGDSIELLKTTEELATAGKADLEATTRLLASTLNAYGKSTAEAGRFSDAFFMTVKDGQTTLPELADSLSQVTSLAASGEIPIETLMAAIAALTAQGDPTSQAITKIRGAIVAMIKPSSQAQTMAKELGIEFGVAALKSKGFEGVMREVYQATGGNEEQMAKLFGRVEGLSAAITLGADRSGKFAGALDDMANKTGATGKAFEKMEENFSNITQNLTNNILATVIEFGEKFLDEYDAIAEGLVNIFKGVSVAIDEKAFDQIFEMFDKIGAEIADNLAKIGEALPEALGKIDYSNFEQSIRGLGSAARDLFKAFFGDVDLTTVDGLKDAIQKIVDSFTSLNEITTGIFEGMQPFVRLLGEMVDQVNSGEASTKQMAGNLLGLATGINAAAGAISAIIPTLQFFAGASMIKAVSNLGGLFKGFKSLENLKLLGAGGAAFGFGYFAGQLINEYVPGVQAYAQEIFRLTDKVINFTGTQGLASEEMAKTNREFDAAKQKFAEYQESMKKWSNEIDDLFKDAPEFAEFGANVSLMVTAKGEDADEIIEILKSEKGKTYGFDINADIKNLDSVFDDLDKLKAKLDEEHTTQIDIDVDTFFDDLDRAEKELRRKLPGKHFIDLTPQMIETKQFEELRVWVEGIGEQIYYVPIEADAETDSAEKKLDELTTPKSLEIRLQGDIDTRLTQLKTEAEKFQAAVEWKAKLDIANVEAGTERLKSVLEYAGAIAQSTGDVISGIFDKITEVGRGSVRSTMERQLDKESKMRTEAHDKAQALTQAQIDLLNLKAETLRKGGGLITIKADGLQPELEAFMWKIIEKVQIRGVEDEADFLKGIS